MSFHIPNRLIPLRSQGLVLAANHPRDQDCGEEPRKKQEHADNDALNSRTHIPLLNSELSASASTDYATDLDARQDGEIRAVKFTTWVKMRGAKYVRNWGENSSGKSCIKRIQKSKTYIVVVKWYIPARGNSENFDDDFRFAPDKIPQTDLDGDLDSGIMSLRRRFDNDVFGGRF